MNDPLHKASQPSPFGIELVGSSDFGLAVNNGLSLLQQKIPKNLRVVQDHVDRIEQDDSIATGYYAMMYPGWTPSTAKLRTSTACNSTTRCAAVIVHESIHSKKYHEYRMRYGEPVPRYAWAGISAEVECQAYELRILILLDAPQYERAKAISLLKHHTKRYFDAVDKNWHSDAIPLQEIPFALPERFPDPSEFQTPDQVNAACAELYLDLLEELHDFERAMQRVIPDSDERQEVVDGATRLCEDSQRELNRRFLEIRRVVRRRLRKRAPQHSSQQQSVLDTNSIQVQFHAYPQDQGQ